MIGETRRESPSEYIEKHLLNEVTGEMGDNASQELSRMIGIIEYQEKGDASIESELLKLNLSYETPDLNPEDFGRTIIEKFPEFMNNFKEMTSLKLKSGDATLNIFDITPKDVRIFFNPYIDTHIGYISGKKIFIGSDINKPRSILALLHEIGHSHENEIIFQEEKNRGIEPQEDLAQLLVSERNAWAFALKKIKPFLNNPLFKKDAVSLFMKRCLTNYEDKIKKDLLVRKNISGSLKSTIPNEHFDEFLDFPRDPEE